MSEYEGNPYGTNYSQGGGGSGGGGGFMSGSQGGGSQGGAAKDQNNTTLRPVTIRQLINATSEHEDANFSIEGHDIGAITFVGIVRAVQETQTNINYTVEDGTGQIACMEWIDASQEESAPKIRENHYVRVVGPLKTFQNRRSIKVVNVHEIEDHNEVFFHKLDVMYTQLKLSGGGGGGGGGGGVTGGKIQKPGDYNNWTKASQDLWQLLAEAHKGGTGDALDLRAAVGKLNQKYSYAQLKEAAEALSDNGAAYETQEDHFMITD